MLAYIWHGEPLYRKRVKINDPLPTMQETIEMPDNCRSQPEGYSLFITGNLNLSVIRNALQKFANGIGNLINVNIGPLESILITIPGNFTLIDGFTVIQPVFRPDIPQ